MWNPRINILISFQAEESKKKIKYIKERNTQLINNILPSYVATHFMQNQEKDETVRTNERI